jgi:16S rRNA processing protein RimM
VVSLGAAVAQGFAARLSDVRTREEADGLRGMRLFAERDRLPDLPDDEFYHADLIGLEVFDTGGVALGRVKAVLNHGASDLLELVQPGQSGAVLLPFTRAIVPTVDLAAGRIIADPPEGLIE